MIRRLVILLVAGLGLALAGLYLFRDAAIESLIAKTLTARGVVVGGLSVTRVGLDELHIADLSLGAKGELRIRSLRVSYELATLLRGEIETIAVAGLVLRLDLSGATPPLGSLQPLIPTADGGAAGPLPVIEFSDARIEAATPLGPVTVALDGEAWPEEAGAIAGAFSFTLDGAQGRLIGAFELLRAASGTMTGNLVVEDGALTLPGAEIGGLLGEASYALFPDRPPRLEATLTAASVALPGAAFEEAQLSISAAENSAEVTARMSGAGGRWSLALDGALADYLAAPTIQVEMSAVAEAGAALWPLLALPEPAAGRAQVRITTTGTLAPLGGLGEDGATAADWLSRAELEGQLVVELSGLTYPGRSEAISGELRMEGAFADGKLEGPASLRLETPEGLRLDGDARVRLEFTDGYVPDVLSLDDLRLAARALPLPGLRLTTLEAEGALAGRLPALAGELSLNLEAEDIAIGPLRAATAKAAFPVALQAGPGTLSLRLTAPGRVALQNALYGEAVRVAALRATVKEGELTYAGGVLEHAATLALAPSEIRLGDELVVDLTPGTVRLQGNWAPDAAYRATAKIADAGFGLPAQNIAVANISADLNIGPAPGTFAAEIVFGAITDHAEAPRFSPLDGRLTARGDGEALTFEGAFGERGGAARLAISGSHDLAAGRGAAKMTLAPLTFSPGKLQPAALAPPLGGLRAVTGGLRAEAEVAWSSEGMTGGAVLAIEDLSFDSDLAEVRNLDLAVTLTSLMPPASAPGQRLTVRSIDPGVALDEVAVRFQILPGDPPRLAIERGQVRISGGHVLLRDVLLDPAAQRLALPLDIEGLDLAELFRILDIAGLSGSGRLSGRIPIALEGESVTIANGRLAAEAPGTLRFESERARQALAAAGESAELMLRALEDFRYDELSLTIDKPATAAARLTLVLLGHNPDVLDGYPFRFNINLEGDTDRLVAALSQAYRLSNRMLRKFWRPASQ